MGTEKKLIQDLKIGEPFLHFRTLNVKLLKKTDLRNFSNKGVVFNALFMDEEGTFTEAVSFSQKKYEELTTLQTYDIRKFDLQKPE